jgi:hypothetical protein
MFLPAIDLYSQQVIENLLSLTSAFNINLQIILLELAQYIIIFIYLDKLFYIYYY